MQPDGKAGRHCAFPRPVAVLRLLLLSLILAAPLAAQPLPPRADSLARAFLAATGAPSLVVGITQGGVRTVAGYGLVDGAAPDAATRYEIGSITKTFTALALARAVERGDVALDTPVQTLLPDSIRLAVVGRPMTLVDLATHTSGLPRLPVPFAPASIIDPYADYTEADLMRFLGTARPDSAGVRAAYSNLGVGLLATLLARHERLGVEALLVRDAIAPLGLTATSFSGAVAQPHTTSGRPIAAWSWTDALAGAGALRSDADDLLTLAEAVARPDRFPDLAPALRLVVAPRFDARRYRLGLVWHLMPTAGPVRLALHDGATFGSVAFVGVVLDADVGIVLLSNSGASAALGRLAADLRGVLVPEAP